MEIVEAEEKEKINTEIGQRRTRLGSRIDQVTAEVKREVLEQSPLEDLYQSIIDWTYDDEVRRQNEEKVLQHAEDTLAVLPTAKKSAKREQVQKLADGLVILKHPFLLAWRITLEWKDVEEIKDLDVGLLREFVELFPNEGLSKVLRGYLESEVSPFPKAVVPEDKSEEENEVGPLTAEDRLVLMTEGMEDASKSILAHRLIGQFYLFLDEHESAVAIARVGLNCIASESSFSGVNLIHTSDSMNTILATALVHYQAPRYHSEARSIFESILSRKPTETSALIGIGMIYEEQEDFAEAVNFLARALKRSQDPKIRAEAAWCKALNGDSETGLQELEASLTDMEGSDTRMKALRSQTLYRIGMCLWSRDTSDSARKDRSGAYARFLASLQADMNFAPAYTSLGIYYSDYSKDKKRARKCFQKAFELSASEIEAAERLAKSFAKSREWDLVEVVAQRVVESGKMKRAPGSKKKGISWPFAALGVVQLNNQEWAKSTVSFQSALRISPSDYNCWVGLGESYHNSGRYMAATKALENAQQLVSTGEKSRADDIWFSKYMLANVKRELGEMEEAINGYRQVLDSRPKEYGVQIALLQTLVEAAWRSIELGFYGRAADGADKAIKIARGLAKEHSDAFNLWKAVGDACSIFSLVQAYAEKLPLQEVRSLLKTKSIMDTFDLLSDVDGIGKDVLQAMSNDDEADFSQVTASIYAAILAHKRAIHACANDKHAKAVAWYNLGWTEHRAHVCNSEERQSRKRKSLRYLKAAVQCFKRAIELEAGNSEFWNSLGIVTTDLSPKVSQHSFIRSLYLNDRDSKVWTNLGVLYLIQGDSQLANEAFTRAQSTDPDYAQAWVGQGLLASQSADTNEARHLFTQAFEVSDSSSTVIKQHYAMSTFDHLISSSLTNNKADALQPLFALHQLRSQIPSSLAFQHLSSLFAERVGDFADANSKLELVCSKLEVEYEASEATLTLLRFAQAKADLARIQLAKLDFDMAAENAETALDLSADEDEASQTVQKLRLSAHMTAGLAYHHQGSMDESIDMFKKALQETHGNPDIICLLSQVLWAKGAEKERNVAREQLLDCIENHHENVGATLLLGAIAILEDDPDTLETVKADLESLRTRDSLTIQEQSKTSQLLSTIASLHPSNGGKEMSELAQATTAVMLAPSQPFGWSQLAELSDEPYPAEMAVLAAVKAVPPRGSLEARDLCNAYVGTGRIGDAQKAIMVAPWMTAGWDALA